MNRAEHCRRLLDNGWSITLSAQETGGYLAVAFPPDYEEGDELPDQYHAQHDDIAEALYEVSNSALSLGSPP